jgi:hypothetical protein
LRVAEGEFCIPPSTTRIRKKTMVSAVSSQAATLNPLAYMALDGDDNAKQPASNATPNDSDRGPATQVSLSQDALDRLMAALKQGPSAAQQGLDQLGQASEERVNQKIALMQVNMEFETLDAQAKANEARAGMLKWLNESYTKWQNATPVPAVQLTKTQIADVLKKAAPLGIDPSKIGTADNYIFAIDGMQYTFKKAGTAWMNEAGIPTSEEQKQYVLQEMSKTMAYLSTQTSVAH